MKIIYDGSFLISPKLAGGIARDSLSLIEELRKQFQVEIYYSEPQFFQSIESLNRMKIIKSMRKLISLIMNLLKIYPKRQSRNVYWQSQPGVYIPSKNSNWIMRLHDLYPLTFPHDYSYLQRKIFKRSIEEAVKRAIFVVNSVHTKMELIKKYGSNLKIFVIPCQESRFELIPCDKCAICINSSILDSKYVLNVGTLFARRNINATMDFAVQLFNKTGIKTYVIGRSTSWRQRMYLKLSTDRTKIEFLGTICDAKLSEAYDSTMGYISLSQDEGFNIPLLDALVRGIPSLVSDIPAHRELLIDKDCFDEESFLLKLKHPSENVRVKYGPKLLDETYELTQFIRSYLC
jgi:glycosyltransferase involved in cell wall biosynthesis